MHSKRKVLSDNDLIDRLVHMGLMTDAGTVSEEVMSVFAGIFSGVFIWDVRQYAVREKHSLRTIYEVFQELEQRQEYHNMYLMLSIQYDQMGKTLPDPIWWLMCSEIAVEGFMRHFMKRFDAFMAKNGLYAGEGKEM